MEMPMPFGEEVNMSADASSSNVEVKPESKGANIKVIDDKPAKEVIYEGLPNADSLLKRAEMYQEYMKQIPIPKQGSSIIPFTSWTGLASSIKQLYRQPLHYLTNIRLKQWDQSRIGAEDEDIPLGIIIHPSKAETTIWLIEEVYRQTSSHHHLAKLWMADPIYQAAIDPMFPRLS